MQVPRRRPRLRWLRALAVDTGPLRHSRDYRLLAVGGFVSGMGTQVTLVALPYQVYVLTRSSFEVGMIGLAELLPLAGMSLLGGALADRTERRRLLLISQLVQLSTSSLLALGAATGKPPVAALYVLAGVAAAASGVDRPTRTAIIPSIVGPNEIQPAVAFNYGLAQLTMVIGPALGGIVIAAAGLGWAYALDVATFAAMVGAVALMHRLPAPPRTEGESVLAAVRSGLRFAVRRGELMGSFAADLLAMTFGMPRALFPALALTVYHAGATGVGLLYAALASGMSSRAPSPRRSAPAPRSCRAASCASWASCRSWPSSPRSGATARRTARPPRRRQEPDGLPPRPDRVRLRRRIGARLGAGRDAAAAARGRPSPRSRRRLVGGRAERRRDGGRPRLRPRHPGTAVDDGPPQRRAAGAGADGAAGAGGARARLRLGR